MDKNYEFYKNAGVAGEEMIQKNYFKGFKPGPFSNFAKVLAEHPFARLPINGLALGNLLSPYMQAQFGWNPWFTHGIFAGTDWLLQTRHEWAKLLTRDSFYIEAKSFKFLGKSFELFGHTYYTPYFRMFSLNNPSSFGSWTYQKYLNVFYSNAQNVMYSAGITERPWFSAAKNIWSKTQPYAKNFFNPGFFMGFGWIPYLTPTMGGWAYLAGPVLGSATWLGVSRMAQALAGAGPGFISQFNQWGWMGTMVGFGLDLLIPGNQSWLPTALGIGFPIAGSILTLFGTSFTGILSSGLAAIGTAIPALAGLTGAAATGLAAWATVMSVAWVAGLTIFFAYTIYAGFWVPMIEEGNAQPQSSNFSINSNCTLTAPNQYNCCSNFNVTENILNSRNFLDHNTDFSRTNLAVDLNDPATTTNAFRGKQLDYKTYVTEWANGNNYSLVIPPGNMINDVNSIPYLDAFLPTPSDQTENLFTLMQTNSSVVFLCDHFSTS